MEIDWKKKRLKYKDGSWVYWGIKRKKFWFKNKKELEMNVSIISHFENQIDSLKKVIKDHQDFECDIQEYVRHLQKLCGIEPGSFCEMKSKDGIVRKFIRRGKDYEEIKL